MDHDPLGQIFANLDRWRHLPSYQCERRLDIFLSPFLQDILRPSVGRELDPLVIPEMPLKQQNGNLTDKADYVLFSRDREKAYVLELKTDSGSFRAAQDKYLDRVTCAPWKQTLELLKDVVRASKSRRKYFHLLSLLQRAGQVKLHPDLLKSFEGRAARFLPEWVHVTTTVQQVECWYIVPAAREGKQCITFDDICRRITGLDDVLSPLLVKHLRRWTDAAGKRPPESDVQAMAPA